MDQKLVGWGRAVKSRRRGTAGLPPLWLFTDAVRGGDPRVAALALPKGLCGIVFRHDGAPGRAALLRAVWRICRARRNALVVAGAGPVPPGAGRHVRGGWGRGRTASAHGQADMVRARRAGVREVFVSPVFATASHPGVRGLGVWRFGLMTRGRGVAVLALGGIEGQGVRRLPRWVKGVGAIGALLP